MKHHGGRHPAIPALVAVLGGFPLLARAADPWPTGPGVEIGHVGEMGHLPAGYEPSGAVWHPGRSRLLVVSDDGLVSEMTAGGDSVVTWVVSGNLEGIALPDPAGDLVLVGSEDPDAVVEFDLATGLPTGNSWDLTPWMTGPANRGLEALTMVGSLAYAGLQDTGEIFVFQLLAGDSVVHVATLPPPRGFDGISGLDFDPQTGTVFALHDKRNRLFEMTPLGAVFGEYSVVGDDQEGFALVSGNAPGLTDVFIAVDPVADPREVWRYAGYPVDWPPSTSAPESSVRGSELGAFPNPFRRSSAVRIDLAVGGFVTLTVHDVLGRRIRTMAHGVYAAGPTDFAWDGRDEKGRAAPAGTYLIRLVTPSSTRGVKVTRVD